jgi:hypothetical protein
LIWYEKLPRRRARAEDWMVRVSTRLVSIILSYRRKNTTWLCICNTAWFQVYPVLDKGHAPLYWGLAAAAQTRLGSGESWIAAETVKWRRFRVRLWGHGRCVEHVAAPILLTNRRLNWWNHTCFNCWLPLLNANEVLPQ